MVPLQRALLRLHVEAVWGVQLPPAMPHDVELLSTSFLPDWKLCAADLDGGRVCIWRPDVAQEERADVLARVSAAMALPATASVAPEIHREVALQQVDSPTMSLETAQALARPLTMQDQTLVETFDPGSIQYYFHPHRQPLFGVVVEGRLLSLAHSSRRTPEACELGVATLIEARRRGYALAATILWAAAVAQEGLIPIYSASADNTASLKLAAAAGYRAFAHIATIHE